MFKINSFFCYLQQNRLNVDHLACHPVHLLAHHPPCRTPNHAIQLLAVVDRNRRWKWNEAARLFRLRWQVTIQFQEQEHQLLSSRRRCITRRLVTSLAEAIHSSRDVVRKTEHSPSRRDHWPVPSLLAARRNKRKKVDQVEEDLMMARTRWRIYAKHSLASSVTCKTLSGDFLPSKKDDGKDVKLSSKNVYQIPMNLNDDPTLERYFNVIQYFLFLPPLFFFLSSYCVFFPFTVSSFIPEARLSINKETENKRTQRGLEEKKKQSLSLGSWKLKKSR